MNFKRSKLKTTMMNLAKDSHNKKSDRTDVSIHQRASSSTKSQQYLCIYSFYILFTVLCRNILIVLEQNVIILSINETTIFTNIEALITLGQISTNVELYYYLGFIMMVRGSKVS